ncbi:Glyoxalase/Bleomycin resistance protein/Dihydroxybiphenyl dioxygenase [Periconia macrospinosa]|uniref:Glyoxalase/Bleomycin resistance protein/Dihydroxybiphenyl dioxygenase n=1 Tax=Periconia macrospinosa TaxID=97972 RepID=A0A2V1DBI5_9PLEO|nr:Glyoxalase/Bleomycin resistance protein/Dihydroxybiphenyl dioxygenase [Periconia macrospinosa]
MSASKVTVSSLAHVHYQHPDMSRAAAFLQEFGLIEEKKVGNRSYLRGYGAQPYIYIAEPSPDGERHFLGAYWVVDSREELQKAEKLPGATAIQKLDAPGQGEAVTVTDPNGNLVGFVYGQELRQVNAQGGALERDDSSRVSNTAADKRRKGTFRRFDIGPSPVHKLGHYGYMVPAEKFEETLAWYTSVMNLKPTDSRYTDHHSFFLGVSAPGTKAHVHHSSFEVDDFDTQELGHDYLRSKGWTNCWGLGRHVMGSQIFDYWFDGSGNVLEHYSDGDLVNEDTPIGREPAAPNTLYIWGPNIPLGFVTGRVEDAGKPLPMPPDVVAGVPAEISTGDA